MQPETFAAHARLEDRHWWFTARRAILKALLHAIAPPGHGVPVVDIGCGTGGNIGAFAGEYAALGLDPSPDAIAFARQRFPSVQFECTDNPEAARPHLAGGGVVLMTDVLEHVQDDRGVFERVLAIVPSGGHLVLTVPSDPALWSPHDEEFGHFRRYMRDDFRALWTGAPVDERLLSPFNARLRPVIATIRRVRHGAPVVAGGDLTMPAGPLNGALRAVFAGEAHALVSAIDSGSAPYARGVSLVAVLRRK